MDNLAFSPVTYDDIDTIKDIYSYYINNSTATFHINEISNEEMEKILFFEDDLYKSYVIKSNNTILGYVLLCPYSSRQAYRRTAEVTIYLKHDIKGKGIGTKAISFIEGIAIKKGIKTLLSVICGENTASIKLFEKCGYTKCAHITNVGEKFGRLLDIVIYEKELN